MSKNHQYRSGVISYFFRFVIVSALVLGGVVVAAPAKAVEARPAHAPLPGVTIDIPEDVFIGSDFKFTVSFDNATAGTTGYGPFIDVIFPVNGADGDPYGDPLADPPVLPEVQDGIDFKSATYLGQTVEAVEVIFDENGKALHPYAKNPDGSYMEITGTPGDKLVSFRLPFGSIVPEQPAIDLEISAHLSNMADLGTPLTLRARSGFMFGADPLDNFCCDWVVLNPASNDSADWNGTGESADVLPDLVTLSKTYIGPENETATGPNYPREFTINATIATGQVLNPLTIVDTLPSNMQFLAITANPQGASCSVPSTSTPGGSLSCDFANASGTVSLTYRFYIGYADSGSTEVIPPDTGADATSLNSASAQADWQPIDTRDPLYEDYSVGPVSQQISDEPIVIQKGITNTSDAVNSPGDVLRYTLSFQVSDYFALNQIKVTDVLSDGQHLDSSQPVTIAVNGNPFTLSSVSMDADNVDVACNYSYTGALPPECDRDDPAANDGKTTIVFDVSQELIDRSLQDGKLIGGCIPATGTGTTPDPLGGDPIPNLPDCSSNVGGTTGTITFYTIVQDNFTDMYPSGDPSVDQGDRLNNTVSINGSLLSVVDVNTPLGPSSSNGSGAGLNIAQGGITKKIYALNGSTTFENPLKVAAGDEVTFEMTYSLPTSDFEDLKLTDYFPLPVFLVANDFADGTGRFDNDLCSTKYPTTGTPPAGYACLAPSDSYHTLTNAVSPTLTVQAGANSIQFGYGNYDITTHPTTKISLLFTATVSNQPFTDLLYLTNQARGQEGSTNAADSQSDSIVQIVLTEPYLVGSKGAISSDNPEALLNPDPAGPVTFNTAGTSGKPWASGIINSDGLAANPIGSDIGVVDAGDLVRFAIVVENQGTGSNGAFDIRIKDILPEGFVIPSGGLNLTVTRGDGTTLNFTYLGSGPDGTDGTPDDLFGNGIEISDDPDLGACQHYNPTDGRNIALITYDLQVAEDIKPNTTITNGGTLFNYAADEGGPDFTGDDNDQTFSADTVTAVPTAAKSLFASSIDQASGPNTLNHVTVGETVDYETTLTIPEGELPAVTMVDTLKNGLVFLECVSMSASTGLSSDSLLDLNACPVPVISNNGRTASFDFGNLVNANNSNDSPETLTLKLRAVVINSSAVSNGVTLNNQAVWAWEGDSETVTSENVTVLEPVLQVEKTESHTPPLDAGDTVTYTLVVSHTAASTTDAYDVSLVDLLPTGMSYIPGTLQNTAGLAPTSVVDATLTVVWDTFALTDSSTLTFEAQPTYNVAPDQTLTNTVNITWTSLPGNVTVAQTPNSDVSTERTGDTANPGGAQNDYRASDTLDLTVEPIHPAKSLVSTSEPSSVAVSGTQRVLVGEIVRYRVSALLPEGTSNGLTFVDTLPNGLQFLDDSSAKVAFVSGNASACPVSATIISSTLTPPVSSDPSPWVCGDETSVATIQPAFVLPASALSVSGNDVTFSMGDLQNNDGDADSEYVVVEFNALVTNVSGNQAGTTLSNTFKVGFAGNYSESSDPVSVMVAEPNLTINKELVTPAPQDAGDPITFRITLTNNSNTVNGDNQASAFDVKLSDILPDYVDLEQLTDITITKPAYAVLTDNSSVADDKLDITLDRLNPGDTLVVEVKSVLAADLPPGWIIDNTANMTYTSLPQNGSLSPDNDTGSVVPGASGSATGERDGSNGAGSGLNNYAGSEKETLTTALPSIVKQPVTPTKYAIGEQVTYDILVTLPEGLTSALKVNDLLPAGLQYVSHQIITTTAAAGSLLSANFNASAALSATSNSPAADGADLTLDFGAVTVTNDNQANNNTFQVRVTAQVLNVSNNQSGTVLNNQASLNYTNPNTSATDTINSSLVAITVVEPALTITKTVQTAPNPADAGGTLVYSVTITNASGANVSTAYEVRFTDTLNSALTLGPIVYGGSAANNTVGNNVDLTFFSIAPGGSITVTISTTLNLSVQPYYLISNQGRVTYTSLGGVVSGERDGSGGINDYIANSSIVTTRVASPSIAKTVTPARYTIGEQLTYTILVTLPEGTLRSTATNRILLTDLLPPGLKYVSHQVQTSGGALTAPYNGTLPAITANSPTNSGDDLVLTFEGDVVTNMDNVTNNNRFQVNLTVQVVNEVGNQLGTILGNNATLRYYDPNTANGTRLASISPQPTITVTEPVLSISKVVQTAPSPADAGGNLVYLVTITNASGANVSTAYDVRFTDTLAEVLQLNSVTPSVASAADASSGNTIDLTFASIAPGGSITLTINTTILGTAQPGQVINNTGAVTYTSLSGVVSGERTGPSGGVDPLNDYSASASATAVTLDKPSIVKLPVTPDKYTIGEQVTYDLLVTLPEGTIKSFYISDLLPIGLEYDGYQVIKTGFGGNVPNSLYIGSNPGVSGGDVTFGWFSDITTTANNNPDDNTFSIQVKAKVVNESANQAGTTLVNQARLGYSNPVDGQPTSLDSGTVTITVVEPALSISKVVKTPPSPADAGGTLEYEVTISNASGANVSTAYDVRFTDTLAGVLQLNSVTPSVAPAADASSGNALDLTFDSIAPGASVTLTINTTILGTAQPGQVINNTGTVTYTSLSGVVSGERTGTDGTGGLNDYTTSASAPAVTLDKPSIVKLPVTPTKYTVGEQVTYDLLVTLAEGTTNGVKVSDLLPVGLKYVSHEIITTQAATGSQLSADFAGSALNATPNTPTATGDDLELSFGTVTVTNDNQADNNTFQIRVTAQVVNELGNQAGSTLDNQARLTYTNPVDGQPTSTDSGTVTITVVEPALSIVKAVQTAPSPADAGGTLVYQVTISNAGGANNSTAYDVRFTDTLNNVLTPGTISVVGSTYTDNTVGNAVDLMIDSIAPGASVTVTINTTVNINAQPYYEITNQGNITYTSLAGAVSGERDGTDGTGGLNDYTASSNVVSNRIISPTITKTVTPATYTIGEQVSYTLLVRMPEGTAKNLVVTDQLPAGLKFVSYQVLPNGSALTTPYSGALSTTTDNAPANSGDDLTISFTGDVVTNANNDATDNTFQVTVTALVVNEIGNQIGTTLDNDAYVRYQNPNDTATTRTHSIPTQPRITILEPRIATTKSVSPTTNVQQGDTLTYTVTFSNTGNSTAYEVNAQDQLPSGVALASLTSCKYADNSDAGGSASESGGVVTLTGNWEIVPNGSVTCEYTATAQISLYLYGTHTNTVDADWSSLDGGQPTVERVYDDGTTYTVDGDQDTAQASFTSSVPTFAKSDGGITTRAIGDSLTYTLTVGGPKGTLRGLVVKDTLPAGLVFGSTTVINGLPTVTPVVSAPDAVTGAVTVTWNFGDAEKTATDAVITYTAVVGDVASNQQGVSLSNSATLNYKDAENNPQTELTGSDDFSIEEPKIVTIKAVTPTSGVQAGDDVQYTVRFSNSNSVVTAYDVTAQDTLAQGVAYKANTAACVDNTTAPVGVTVSVTGGGTTLTFDGATAGGWDIPASGYIQCTYTATAQSTLHLDGAHTNIIDADWSSQDGTTNPEDRVYDDSGSSPLDNDDDADDAVFNSAAPTLAKSDGGTTVRTIGDVVTYTLTLNGPRGTLRNLVVQDALPAGLIYNNDAIYDGLPAPTGVMVSTPNDGSAQVNLAWTFGDAYQSKTNATITFTATVADVPANQQAAALSNYAQASYTDAGGANKSTDMPNDGFTIEEPKVITGKSVSPTSGVQAGDDVQYTVRFTNSNALVTAYDVTAQDTLAQGVAYKANTAACVDNTTAPVGVTVSVTGGGTTLTFDGATAGGWDIPALGYIQCTYTATAQSTLHLDGLHTNIIDADWSSQDGTTNSEDRVYDDTGSSPMDNDEDADDAVFTSGAPTFTKTDSGTTALTIGETVTYTLTIGGPNGTLRGLVVADSLPAGLIYTGNLVITGLTPSNVTPTVSSPNDGSAAVNVTWNFGDAQKTQDEATIVFTARVANVDSNQAGTNLNNQAALDHKAADGVTDQPQLSGQDDLTVQEPLLTVDKTILSLPDPLDAGGTLTYRVVITNPGGTNIIGAQDAHFVDTLPATLALQAASISITPLGGASGAVNNSSGNTVVLDVDGIPVGGSVTLEYSATILVVGAGASVDNTGRLTWTSLSGPSANERTGADGAGGLNDYAVEDGASFTVSNPAITKSLVDPLDGLVTIGQIVTYELAVSLPEGETQNLVVADTLPSGLAYVDGSLSLNTDAAHYNGTPAVPAYTFTPPAASSSGGGTLTVSFSDTISLTGDNDPTNNILILRFQAVMLDIPANFGSKTLPVVLTNSATVQAGGGPLDNSNEVDVTVVEPSMEIEKSVLSPADGKIAGGDIVTFQLLVRNVGTSTAYDVVVEDPLPTSNSGLLFDSFTRTDSAAGFSFETEVSGDDTIVRYSGGSVPADGSVTLTFTARVTQSIPNSAFTNTATVRHATTLSGAVTGERDEPEVQGTAPLTGYSIDPAIEKDDSNATAVPGQPVIYTLAVRNDGNRTATGVTITEVAPANTAFDSANSTSGWDCTTFPTCTFSIATLDPGVWVDSPLYFAITVVEPFPQDITSFTNNVSIADDGNNGDDVDTTNNTDSEETPVNATPDLTISKTDGITMTALGAELTYTITVTNVGDRDAKEVELVDTLPALDPNAQVTYVADSASDGGVYDAATGKITWPLFDLSGKGGEVTRTFRVTVNDLQPAGASTIINTVEVHDNGIETNTNDNTAEDVDYLSTSDKLMTGTNHAFTAGLDVAIGEVLTYQTTLTIPSEGADNVILTDQMDAGLAFIGCEVIPSAVGVSATPNALDTICDNPVEPNAATDPDDPQSGRTLQLNFGSIANSTGAAQSITVRYTVAVLDTADNTRGDTLTNHAHWTWKGGVLDATTPAVTVLEPTLTISKTAPKKTALPGGVVDYTITFGHSADSSTDAFDVLLTDVLPRGMSYIPGTLQILSGPTYDDFTVTSTLPNRLTLVWDTLAQGTTVTLQFSAIIRANISGGTRLVNNANVEWTSLPGDYLTPAPEVPGPRVPQSPYNNSSTERYYDPASPVNLYGASSEFVITTPEDDDLPETGFAPGRVTPLPVQPADRQYQDLSSMRIEIPALGLNLPITGVPLTESGWDLTWLGGQTGYLEGTAFPTWAGNSAITAHVFDANGQPGPFASLNQLKWGDQIIIHFGGQRYIYEMRSSLRTLPGDLSLLRHETYPWLTLITCQGYDQTSGQYDWRYAVRAVQVRVEPE